MGANQRDGLATQLLLEARRDDGANIEELLRLVYDDLRAVAAGYLRRERVGHTLQPTALVNEVYLRLIRSRDVEWSDRNHFFAIAARCIRRILTEHARRRDAQKRGHGFERVTLCEVQEPEAEGLDVDLLRLELALAELEARDARRARVVELRFFGGLSVDDTAETLGVSPRTVKSDWRFARAWLFARLDPGEE